MHRIRDVKCVRCGRVPSATVENGTFGAGPSDSCGVPGELAQLYKSLFCKKEMMIATVKMTEISNAMKSLDVRACTSNNILTCYK